MSVDDNQILGLLRQNARLTSAQIAERLELTAAQVEQVIERCEAASVIRGYYTLIDDEALGQQKVRALIEVCVQPERDGGFDPVARRLAKFPEVTDVILVSGSYDLQLLVEGQDLQEVAHFVASKLAPLEGVQSTRTHFLLKKYKEAGFQYEEDEDYERLKVSP
jgi:DNA-binding Lrp family transcriptional regulator